MIYINCIERYNYSEGKVKSKEVCYFFIYESTFCRSTLTAEGFKL